MGNKIILPANSDYKRSIHKVAACRALEADTMEHLIEYTNFLVGQGWSEYGGVKIVVGGHKDGKSNLFVQLMVCYEEEKLE